GNLEGQFVIPFEADGSLGEDYSFFGKISNASINLTKQFPIKNLTAEIKDLKNSDGKGVEIVFEKGSIYDLELADTIINLKRAKNAIKIDGLLRTKGKFNFSQIKKISSLFGLDTSNFNEINGTADLKTNINFNVDSRFRIKNPSYSMEGDIAYFEIHTDEKRIIKNYLPEYDPKIILKDTHIKIVNSESNYKAELSGYLKVNENFDSFKINKVYNYDKKSFYTNGIIDLTNSRFKVSRLNY
ncbi:uncharacterized protein METZ01_LOCUS482705, partial [marine metagenome]